MKKLTKIQIIEETVKFYSNNKRAITSNERCAYLTESGLRCAHSRCIKKKVLTKLVKEKNNNSASSIINDYSDSCHLKKYQGHNENFWDDIQTLHDTNMYWKTLNDDKNELTIHGVKFVESLKEKYKYND